MTNNLPSADSTEVSSCPDAELTVGNASFTVILYEAFDCIHAKIDDLRICGVGESKEAALLDVEKMIALRRDLFRGMNDMSGFGDIPDRLRRSFGQ